MMAILTGVRWCFIVVLICIAVTISNVFHLFWVFLVAQVVKNLPAMQETRVWFLGWKDSLEKGMATHSSILAWEIPWTDEPGGLQLIWLQRARHDWATNIYTHTASLHVLLCHGHLHIFFGEMSVSVCCPFFKIGLFVLN